MVRTWQDKVKDDAEVMFEHIGAQLPALSGSARRLASAAQAAYDRAGEAAQKGNPEWALNALQNGALLWGQVLERAYGRGR